MLVGVEVACLFFKVSFSLVNEGDQLCLAAADVRFFAGAKATGSKHHVRVVL